MTSMQRAEGCQGGRVQATGRPDHRSPGQGSLSALHHQTQYPTSTTQMALAGGRPPGLPTQAPSPARLGVAECGIPPTSPRATKRAPSVQDL